MNSKDYRRKVKYPETKWFIYDNMNPKGKITTDCVVRSICRAMNVPYDQVYEDMFKFSMKTYIHINDKKFLERYLKKFGYVKMKQPKHDDGTKLTVKEFCEKYNTGKYILSINCHHITSIIDGKVHDIWDCTDRVVCNYWRVDL